jgi:hypothetical protein
MSHILAVLENVLLKKTADIAKKPKTGKLIVGPQGQLHPKAMNLRHSLKINPTRMFTKSQVNKVFITK